MKKITDHSYINIKDNQVSTIRTAWNRKSLWFHTQGKIYRQNQNHLRKTEHHHEFDNNPFQATITGKVNKIFVKPNSKIETGTLILMLEAMKMEFPIVAPTNGKVLEFLVKENELVREGTEFLKWQKEE